MKTPTTDNGEQRYRPSRILWTCASLAERTLVVQLRSGKDAAEALALAVATRAPA